MKVYWWYLLTVLPVWRHCYVSANAVSLTREFKLQVLQDPGRITPGKIDRSALAREHQVGDPGDPTLIHRWRHDSFAIRVIKPFPAERQGGLRSMLLGADHAALAAQSRSVDHGERPVNVTDSEKFQASAREEIPRSARGNGVHPQLMIAREHLT